MRHRNWILFAGFFILASFVFAWAQESNQTLSQEYYKKGNEYYQAGKYKDAQAQYQKALALAAKPEGDGAPPASGPKAQAAEYIIGEADTLLISVWQNNDLTQEVVVRPDGKISFPLIDEVIAGGLTIPKLDANITERLKEFIKYPEVSISLKSMGGKKIFVLGEVYSPGVYTITGDKNVAQAITMAGGFTSNAVANSVVLIQGGFTNPKGTRLDLNRYLLGTGPKQNIMLQPDDIIFVPKKFVANMNYLINQIIGPIVKGAYDNNALRNTKSW